jgi:hypothetical protein
LCNGEARHVVDVEVTKPGGGAWPSLYLSSEVPFHSISVNTGKLVPVVVVVVVMAADVVVVVVVEPPAPPGKVIVKDIKIPFPGVVVVVAAVVVVGGTV